MNTEDWILKSTKLITNTKKQAKIRNLEQRLDSKKYNINKTKQNKNYKIYIYMQFALKIGFFFAR